MYRVLPSGRLSSALDVWAWRPVNISCGEGEGSRCRAAHSLLKGTGKLCLCPSSVGTCGWRNSENRDPFPLLNSPAWKWEG